MGEFSAKNLSVYDGVTTGLAAAGTLIGVPFIISLLLRSRVAGSLPQQDLHSLSTFFLLAVILGVAASIAVCLYDCYPKGTKSRLLFGMLSGALIIVYSFSVLIASGFPRVLSAIGLKLDMIYPALVVTYASVFLMFSFGGEYISSREKWLKKMKAAEKGTVNA